MDMSSFIPALRKRSVEQTATEPTDEERAEAKRQGKVFYDELSGAQQNRYRRMVRRQDAAAKRKLNRRYRRDAFVERQRQATIRGQMAVLNGPDTPMRRNVERALEKKYEGQA